MFINSIFLPKSIPGQGTVANTVNGTNDFTHLFSNVFRIVKDEQENSTPIKMVNLNLATENNAEDELLNVSLLSDKKITPDNPNISMIISGFLSKLKTGEIPEDLSDPGNAKNKEKFASYFSLTKNEFIKEIKKIIDTLNKGNDDSIKGVEISLIANGQSIKIDSLNTDIVKIKDWVNEQLKSNSDFEILVKSNQKEVDASINPIKDETTKTVTQQENILSNSDKKEEIGTTPISKHDVVNTATIKDSSVIVQDGLQQPIEVVKQTIAPINKSAKSLKENSKIASISDADLKKESLSSDQSELQLKSEIASSKKDGLSELNNFNTKMASIEKPVDTEIKTTESEVKLKPIALSSDEIIKNSETVKQTSELNVKENDRVSKKIVLKANQKINSVSINSNSVQEKTSLTELIEKTDVRQIDLSYQKITKQNINNVTVIKNDQQPEVILPKENLTNNQASFSTDQVKEFFPIDEDIKPTTGKNSNTALKDAKNTDINSASIDQLQSKNVKIDLMQRRIYSQIPPLEVLFDETDLKNIKDTVLNSETNKNENAQQIIERPESSQNVAEQKPKTEKQVWVKLSLEKNDKENSSNVRELSPHQSKITIDASIDKIEKDLVQKSFSEKESHENQKSKPQIISVETNHNTEQKPVAQNHNATNQPDNVLSFKPEIKTEHNILKPELHNENTKPGSRLAEMVEKVKVISSGEILKEVYKVFESGEKQSIVLRLVPKELGSMKVMLDTVDNVLTAKVEVENENVGQIVRNNVEQLKQNLLQSGVQVNSINISYHSSDQKPNGFQNQKRKNNSYQADNELEEVDESILPKKFGYNTYEYLV